MYYALVFFPIAKIADINKIRKKFDPTYNLINPHMTIIFPVPGSAGKERIIKHIENILKRQKSFQIHFGELKKSWDHWLFLTLKEGEQDVKKLYNEIYCGFLSQYRRDDIEFIPHISLGLFLKNQSEYDIKNPEELIFDEVTFRQALSEAKSKNLNFKCIVNGLSLVELNDDFTQITPVRNFEFEK